MSRANLFIPLLYLIYIGVVLVIGEGWFLWIVCVVVVGVLVIVVVSFAEFCTILVKVRMFVLSAFVPVAVTTCFFASFRVLLFANLPVLWLV